jgi:hypothetical protein
VPTHPPLVPRSGLPEAEWEWNCQVMAGIVAPSLRA